MKRVALRVISVLAVICLILLGGMYTVYRLSFYNTGMCEVHKENWGEYTQLREQRLAELDAAPYEAVSIQADDGTTLNGRYYANQEDAPVILYFHGYKTYMNTNAITAYEICKENGYNLLVASQRAHNESEGNTITMGMKERYDCVNWAKWASANCAKEKPIFLMGTSMGGGTIMLASNLDLPKNVKGIIEDCGYSSPSVIYRKYIEDMIPVSAAIPPLYQLGKYGSMLFGGFNIEETDCLTALSQTTLPILFIHGEADDDVPVEMAKECYDAAAGEKEILLIPNAKHTQAYDTQPELYTKTVTKFIDTYQ